MIWPNTNTLHQLTVRFWRKAIDPSDPNACWVWRGDKTKDGYGRMSTAAGLVSRFGQRAVHRTAWILTYGSIPDGMQVLHKCDNPPCFNPYHLYLGTGKDNMMDKCRKGRHRTWGKTLKSHPND